MHRSLAALVAVVLAALSLMHLYWAAGGRRARGAAVPEVDGRPAFTPSAAATMLVAAALAVFAVVVAAAGGLLGGRAVPSARAASAVLALVFLARAIGDFRQVGFFKRVRGSRFARLDTWLYSPACLALACAIACVALGSGRS